MNTMADGAAQRLVDEIDLIRAVLEGYPASIARSDALRAARAIRSALAGQPSSGGQGDALAMIGDNLRSMRVLAGKLTVTQDGNVHLANIKNEIARALQLLDPAVAASQPVGISADWMLGYLNTDAPEESREAIRNAFAEYAALSGARQPVETSVEEDVYCAIADMIEPYVQREGSNPNLQLTSKILQSLTNVSNDLMPLSPTHVLCLDTLNVINVKRDDIVLMLPFSGFSANLRNVRRWTIKDINRHPSISLSGMQQGGHIVVSKLSRAELTDIHTRTCC